MPNDESSIYGLAFEMACENKSREEIIAVLGESMEVAEGVLHGSIHGWCQTVEQRLRLMKPKSVYDMMQVMNVLIGIELLK